MIFDTTGYTVASEVTSGATFDASDLKTNDALALAAGVVGAGVIGTGLVIGTYAAPVPMIGGALIATGLGVAAGTLDLDGDSETPTVSTEMAPSDPTA